MFTRIRTVDDLIQVIRSDDNIRRQVKHALFPGIDLEGTLQKLVELNNRHDERLKRVEETLDEMRSENTGRFEQVDKHFEQVDKRFEQVDKRFEQVDKRFEQVDKRFEQVDKRFEQVDKRFEQVDKRFEQVDKRFEQVDKRFAQIDKRFEQVDERFDQVDKRLERVEGDVSLLKGKSFETEYMLKAAGIFGSFVRRGRDGTNDVADRLYDAFDVGNVSLQEIDQVLAADLIWRGKARDDGDNLILIVEVSWLAELHDVERASQRAEIVQRAGLRSLGVVAGVSGWTDEAQHQAMLANVVMANERRVERDSFSNALAALQT